MFRSDLRWIQCPTAHSVLRWIRCPTALLQKEGGRESRFKVSCVPLTPQLEIHLGLVPTINMQEHAISCNMVKYIYTQMSEAGVQVSSVTQRVWPISK